MPAALACSFCTKTPASRCTKCQAVKYCSQSCQKKDWAKHRLWCPFYREIGWFEEHFGEVQMVGRYVEDALEFSQVAIARQALTPGMLVHVEAPSAVFAQGDASTCTDYLSSVDPVLDMPGSSAQFPVWMTPSCSSCSKSPSPYAFLSCSHDRPPIPAFALLPRLAKVQRVDSKPNAVWFWDDVRCVAAVVAVERIAVGEVVTVRESPSTSDTASEAVAPHTPARSFLHPLPDFLVGKRAFEVSQWLCRVGFADDPRVLLGRGVCAPTPRTMKIKWPTAATGSMGIGAELSGVEGGDDTTRPPLSGACTKDSTPSRQAGGGVASPSPSAARQGSLTADALTALDRQNDRLTGGSTLPSATRAREEGGSAEVQASTRRVVPPYDLLARYRALVAATDRLAAACGGGEWPPGRDLNTPVKSWVTRLWKEGGGRRSGCVAPDGKEAFGITGVWFAEDTAALCAAGRLGEAAKGVVELAQYLFGAGDLSSDCQPDRGLLPRYVSAVTLMVAYGREGGRSLGDAIVSGARRAHSTPVSVGTPSPQEGGGGSESLSQSHSWTSATAAWAFERAITLQKSSAVEGLLAAGVTPVVVGGSGVWLARAAAKTGAASCVLAMPSLFASSPSVNPFAEGHRVHRSGTDHARGGGAAEGGGVSGALRAPSTDPWVSVLVTAIVAADTTVASALIERGADVNDSAGEGIGGFVRPTPLSACVIRHDRDGVLALTQGGRKVVEQLVRAGGRFGMRQLRERPDVQEVQSGTPVDAMEGVLELPKCVEEDMSVHHVAMSMANVADIDRAFDVVDALIAAGVSPRARDEDGWTALFWAVEAMRPTVLTAFRDRGFDLAAVGITPSEGKPWRVADQFGYIVAKEGAAIGYDPDDVAECGRLLTTPSESRR